MGKDLYPKLQGDIEKIQLGILETESSLIPFQKAVSDAFEIKDSNTALSQAVVWKLDKEYNTAVDKLNNQRRVVTSKVAALNRRIAVLAPKAKRAKIDFDAIKKIAEDQRNLMKANKK